jgi:hypothetical protein
MGRTVFEGATVFRLFVVQRVAFGRESDLESAGRQTCPLAANWLPSSASSAVRTCFPGATGSGSSVCPHPAVSEPRRFARTRTMAADVDCRRFRSGVTLRRTPIAVRLVRDASLFLLRSNADRLINQPQFGRRRIDGDHERASHVWE